jgi:hypothetical protein
LGLRGRISHGWESRHRSGWIIGRQSEAQPSSGWGPSGLAGRRRGSQRHLPGRTARWEAGASGRGTRHARITARVAAQHRLSKAWDASRRLRWHGGRGLKTAHRGHHCGSGGFRRRRCPLRRWSGHTKSEGRGGRCGRRRCRRGHRLSTGRARATDPRHVGRHGELGAACSAFKLDDIGHYS